MNSSTQTELLTYLRPLSRRMRQRASVEWLTRTAWLALLACAFVLLGGRLWPVENYRVAAIGLVVSWLVGWLGYTVAHRRTPFQAARLADHELALHERLSTALVLSDRDHAATDAFDPTLLNMQLADALAVVRAIEPRRAFPLHVERAAIMHAAIAALACLLLFVLPNPMDNIIAQRQQVAQRAQTEAAKLEKLAQEIEHNKQIDPDEAAALLKQMRDLIARLKANDGDPSKALADLARLQEQLRAKLDPAAPSAAAALDALAQQLAQLAGATDKPKDAAETAQLLEQLASQLDKLSPEQRNALASALERAAAQSAGSNAELAQSLSAMAQSARSDTANTQATQRAAQALRDAASRDALQQAIARALNQSEASQRAIVQAGASQQSGQAQAQGQGNQTSAQTQGQGQGQGQQVGSGGGANVNTLPPANRTGRAGNPTDSSKPFGVGDADSVYSPFAAGQGKDEFVGGQQGADGQTQTQQGKSPLPGTNSPAVVPYTQVYRQYAQIAGQTMERTYIPSGLQNFVKEYFSELEPTQ